MADAVFAEPGGRWRTVALGPAICLVVLIADLFVGAGVHVLGLTVFAVVLAALVSLQVLAARRHASVEVTGTDLRCGTERVALAEVLEVLPPADPLDEQLQPWESAPVLGELSGVPRRRTPVGLRLADGRLVRAWARDGESLREVLAVAAAGADRADDGEGSDR